MYGRICIITFRLRVFVIYLLKKRSVRASNRIRLCHIGVLTIYIYIYFQSMVFIGNESGDVHVVHAVPTETLFRILKTPIY